MEAQLCKHSLYSRKAPVLESVTNWLQDWLCDRGSAEVCVGWHGGGGFTELSLLSEQDASWKYGNPFSDYFWKQYLLQMQLNGHLIRDLIGRTSDYIGKFSDSTGG